MKSYSNHPCKVVRKCPCINKTNKQNWNKWYIFIALSLSLDFSSVPAHFCLGRSGSCVAWDIEHGGFPKSWSNPRRRESPFIISWACVGDLLPKGVRSSLGKPTWVFEREYSSGLHFWGIAVGKFAYLCVACGAIMPKVCIRLLCRLHTSHNLLQFHMFLVGGEGYAVVLYFVFCKLNEIGGCKYNICSFHTTGV